MPKLKKKSIEQRSRADKERKQQIRGKSLHVGNLSEYNTNSQEREFSHETALLHAEGASSNIGNCTGTEKNDGSKQSSAIEMKYTISKLNEPYVAETIVDRYCGLAKFIGTAWALWAQQCHKEKIKASRQVRVYLYRLFRDGGTCGWGGGGYTLLYVYYLVWYTDLGGRGVFRRLTSLLFFYDFRFGYACQYLP